MDLPGGNKSDVRGVIPREEIEHATQWVATITGLPSGFFVRDPEAPTGLGGGYPTIYGAHPILARLAVANPMVERRRDHALWHAALRAIESGSPVAADSVLGPETVWACPVIVTRGGITVLEGAIATFLHTPACLTSPS